MWYYVQSFRVYKGTSWTAWSSTWKCWRLVSVSKGSRIERVQSYHGFWTRIAAPPRRRTASDQKNSDQQSVKVQKMVGLEAAQTQHLFNLWCFDHQVYEPCDWWKRRCTKCASWHWGLRYFVACPEFTGIWVEDCWKWRWPGNIASIKLTIRQLAHNKLEESFEATPRWNKNPPKLLAYPKDQNRGKHIS